MRPSELVRLALHVREMLAAFDDFERSESAPDMDGAAERLKREGHAAITLIVTGADKEDR